MSRRYIGIARTTRPLSWFGRTRPPARSGRHRPSPTPRTVQPCRIGLGLRPCAAPSVGPMRIRIVDAFTDRPFAGNPAGVLLLDAFPDDAWLQNVAIEVNHAETAFAHRLAEGGEADWALRWFTPATEVAMCGHATLATAHVLHTTGTHEGPVRFATRSGVLVATPNEDGSLTLDFPTAPLTQVEVPDGIAEALGAQPLTAFDTGPNVGDLLLELADEKTVLGLAPDHKALMRHSERGIIATARAEDPAGGHDFVSRCFFPNCGIDED